MIPSLHSFLQENIAYAVQKLQKQHILFLIGSGDIDLDCQIELSIIQEIQKGRPIIIKAYESAWLTELPTSNKIYIVKDFSAMIQKMDEAEINHLAKAMNTAANWSSFIIFHIVENTEMALQVLQKLSIINDKLNLSIQLNPSIPSELYLSILTESFWEQEVEVKEDVIAKMAVDLKKQKFSYTHIKIFIRLVLQLLQQRQTKTLSHLFSLEVYEEIGTLQYFIEFNGKSFISQAESLADIQAIEWIFRSLIVVQQNKPQILHLTIDQIVSRSGVEKEKVCAILNLAAGGGFNLLLHEEGLYSILKRAYFEEWSDLKKWIGQESESVKLFEKYRFLAYQHADGSGQLLTGVQLEESNRWQQMNCLQPDWAILYYPDLELVKGYITASELSYKEYLDGQEKARSRRLKFAYQLAGGSVVIGVLILMLSMWALGQKKEAESQTARANLEKKRTDTAYQKAESSRIRADSLKVQALKSAQEADRNATKAKIAEKNALLKKEEAILAKQDALRFLSAEKEAKLKELQAKDEAITQTKLAKLNELKAMEEEENAIRAANRAEKLRIQQLSRANALAVYEDYDNAQFEVGREKATNAYEQFIKNGGNPYDRDLLTALMEGAMRHKPYEYKKDLKLQPLRMVIDNRNEKLAVYGIDQKVKVFNTKSKEEVNKDFFVNKLYGLGFLSDQTIAGASSSSLFLQLTNPKSAFIPVELKGKEILNLFTMPTTENNVWISTPTELNVYDYQQGKTLRFRTSVAIPKVTLLRKIDNYWLCVSGNKLIRFSLETKENKEIKIFRTPITAISGAMLNKWVAIGDEMGNIYILDPVTGEIKAERSKLHLSKISGLETVHFKDNIEILVSTGFDYFVHIFYIDLDKNQSVSLPSPVSLREHKKWITGLSIEPSTLQAITCSVDETMRFWPLDPNKYLFKGVVPINSSNKDFHP